jgi:Sec-independent protein translocase protein TatA
MPFLSPAKLLVVLVVALVVLGPDKLPKISNQIGALWGDFRKFRQQLESEVRGSFPDLPSTETIAQAVRSPLSFLDNLAETHDRDGAITATAGQGVEPFGTDSDTIEPLSREPILPNPEYDHEARFPISDVHCADPAVVVHEVRSDDSSLGSERPSMN